MAAKKKPPTAAKPANDAELADVAAAHESDPPERQVGRPRGRFDPSIPWVDIENAYVWGDTIEQGPGGVFQKKYPSFRDLGRRFKVAPSLVHYYAKRGKWHDRRLAVASLSKEEFDKEAAKSRAREAVSALGVLDVWLQKFSENVEQGKVRADSIADLNTVIRLKKFLEGDADSRTEQRVVVSLEQLQDRHRDQRSRVLAAAGPVAGELAANADEDAALRGELVEGGAGGEEDEEGGEPGGK